MTAAPVSATINRAINMAIRPMSDVAQWGVPDRWSAPLATLASGRGDCEDYAIAKYVALREAGLAENDVRLVIVRELASGEDHAVVAAHVNDKWIVLDNRHLALIEDSDMQRVRPLFVFDRDGVKRFTCRRRRRATRRRRAKTLRPRRPPSAFRSRRHRVLAGRRAIAGAMPPHAQTAA